MVRVNPSKIWEQHIENRISAPNFALFFSGSPIFCRIFAQFGQRASKLRDRLLLWSLWQEDWWRKNALKDLKLQRKRKTQVIPFFGATLKFLFDCFFKNDIIFLELEWEDDTTRCKATMKRYENGIYAISPSLSSDLPFAPSRQNLKNTLVVGQTESKSGLAGNLRNWASNAIEWNAWGKFPLNCHIDTKVLLEVLQIRHFLGIGRYLWPSKRTFRCFVVAWRKGGCWTNHASRSGAGFRILFRSPLQDGLLLILDGVIYNPYKWLKING